MRASARLERMGESCKGGGVEGRRWEGDLVSIESETERSSRVAREMEGRGRGGDRDSKG